MTELFIKKAKLIHGDKYDYSNVKYKKAVEKIIIICKNHGEFEQKPNSHLTGYGCKSCGFENAINKRKGNDNNFIQKANNIHNNIVIK
jgi:hypothetical protein